MKGNCVVAQSGGPTSVINASAAGVLFEALSKHDIEKVYVSQNGVQGILNDNLLHIVKEDLRELEYLMTTPSSSLGSCRYKLKSYEEGELEYIKIFDIFAKYDIKYFFYIGGNDSMDTVKKTNEYAQKTGYDIRILGIPKTIDNDLMGTDHCPGFGSAAKYIASSVLEISQDAKVYDSELVTIVEVMGRNAGWLAASSYLAKLNNEDVPDLIYLPEVPFDFSSFQDDVSATIASKGKVMIVVSEGIKDISGSYVAEMSTVGHDEFNHAQLGGVSSVLKNYIQEHIAVRVKSIELNILQRSAMHLASLTDLQEAYKVGAEAVKFALSGNTGFMVGMKRVSDEPYKVIPELVDISQVANHEKKLPLEFINTRGNNLTDSIYQYLKPLIIGQVAVPQENGLPRFFKLENLYNCSK
jgi:6-phosphofructokinase 1